MRHMAGALAATLALAVVPAGAAASHQPSGGSQHDFTAGGGSNEFATGGPGHLRIGAQSDRDGSDPHGHVQARGDLDGDGPTEPFAFEGEVTCLRVEGNRSAIKYRFKHAFGSGAPFQDGGIQVFIEDNGPPRGGEPVDRSTFDEPEPMGVFDARAAQCDDPNDRLTYERIDSGNFVVHDAP